ncbi:MAG: MFS transporter [Gammaproteobacteria bacterium]|nr:MFS transporter [Gammaproteobacteria bacterium]MBT3869757.1 MFS transporter [Gammaproteobacteria bacterium]MBT4378085.1 MFS transporter [Gammaproteobacteria bacterium]MBT4616525.1 MFS transporter [Gammaproteobacteria bacterium]MBT5198513.1 MFS transporter [Gammaproteobacteria bacterium]
MPESPLLPRKLTIRDRLALFKTRNFQLLWTGSMISMVGDSFSMIALPWLVIQLTDNAFTLGTVMATAAIPRALFILVGGALADRLSPRRVILDTKVLYLVLVSMLAALVITETIAMWMIYVFAFLLGSIGAFAFPAQSAILPQLVEPEELKVANSLMGGTAQICFLVGPALAGGLIVFLSGASLSGAAIGTPTDDLQAIGTVLAIDAVTFMVSWLLILGVRIPKAKDVRSSTEESVLTSIKDGFNYLKSDRSLFTLMFYIAAVGFLAQGPISIGIPLLASERFVEGAASYGLLMSSHSGGALLGIIIAAWLPLPKAKNLGLMVLTLDAIQGAIMLTLGFASETLYGMLILFNMGVLGGFLQIFFMTWIQRRIAQEMLGRIMSVIIFANLGLAPISGALSGYIVEYIGLTILFVGAGSVFLLVAVVSMFSANIRAMGLPPKDL